MKERFYAGLALQKDFDLIGYVKELRDNPQVIIVHEPEKFLIHEMRYANNYNSDREDTGLTHIGYDYHYVVFLYKGLIINVSASNYYPFTDVNFPGAYNFVVYRRVGLTDTEQMTFPLAYSGLASVDEWLSKKNRSFSTRRKVYGMPISREVNASTVRCIENALRISGGIRERTVFNDMPVILPTETWNEEHKVVEVIASTSDSSGHRDSFLFDCVTKRFC